LAPIALLDIVGSADIYRDQMNAITIGCAMPYSENPDLPQFFSADLCRAANIDAATLKNWISREPFALRLREEDRRAIGTGRPHLFTYRTVLQAAICAEFVALGLPPQRAGGLAELFMNLGYGDARDPKRRKAGELFSTGRTVIAAFPAGTQDGRQLWGSVSINLTDKTSLSEVFKLNGVGNTTTAVLLDVTTVSERTRKVFGEDYVPDFRINEVTNNRSSTLSA
jgi:hypothetical protein